MSFLSLDEALKNFKSCRSICDPNDGFKYQIKNKLNIKLN